jgi:hypothetical protein
MMTKGPLSEPCLADRRAHLAPDPVAQRLRMRAERVVRLLDLSIDGELSNSTDNSVYVSRIVYLDNASGG